MSGVYKQGLRIRKKTKQAYVTNKVMETNAVDM